MGEKKIAKLIHAKGKSRVVGYIVVDDSLTKETLEQVWNYAIRVTAENMEVNYPAALEWIQEKYPDWIVVGKSMLVEFNRKYQGWKDYEPPR